MTVSHGHPPYLECSSQGDKRFSAFYARLQCRGGRSIEDIYQGAKVFEGGVTGLNWQQAKGKRAINQDEVKALYSNLWDLYLNENPHLLPVILGASGVSDAYGQPYSVCQATELWRIRCQALGVPMPPTGPERPPVVIAPPKGFATTVSAVVIPPPPPPIVTEAPRQTTGAPRQVVYDIETYPNFFCLRAVDMHSKRAWIFEISTRRNDLVTLLDWLNNLQAFGVEMIGFNNVAFDYPVIHTIMVDPNCRTPAAIYLKANSLFFRQDNFSGIIWESDRLIKQIDLFKIHHFDNKAKTTGLKALEFSMRSDSVEDLPFEPGIMLTHDQMEITLQYCGHDVSETKRFAQHSEEAIKFRHELTERFHRDFTNHNDTKIGKDYLIMQLGDEVCFSRHPETNRRMPRQTPRPSIALGEVIFPYVRFEHPAFQAIEAWFRRQVITQTKGVFGNISLEEDDEENAEAFGSLEHHNISEIHRHADPSTVKVKGNQMRMTKLNCQIEGFTFVFGTGGIHGSLEGRRVFADEEYAIWDLDVTSFYPCLGIRNQIYPEHLGVKFFQEYANVFEMRKQYEKGTALNKALKLALNGTYGDSNNVYSPFYDPKYTMTITINGQLSLCMLAEKLMHIPNLQLIQANTDGMTIRLPRRHEWFMQEICKQWEKTTGLSLEYAQYSKMFIRDVNNYVAVKTNGKVKLKGVYVNSPTMSKTDNKREWHQDQSALIVPMAAEAVMVKNADPEEFVRTHPEAWDFMCRAKAPRGSKLILGDREMPRTLRYFLSRDGEPLVKVSPPVEGVVEGWYKRKNGVSERDYLAWHQAQGNTWNPEIHTGNKSVYATRRMGICSGWKVSECNIASRFDWKAVDYNWYLAEIDKLVIR